MNLETALKGSLTTFAVWAILFGISDSFGFRVVDCRPDQREKQPATYPASELKERQ